MSRKIVVSVTGGGSGFFNNYLHKGGKSNEFLDGLIPYSKEALDDFLGYPPDKYCSAQTACSMAMQARERVFKLQKDTPFEDAVGVGVTASLYKDGQREGRPNLFYISIVQGKTQSIYGAEIKLHHGQNREWQELRLSQTILKLLNHESPIEVDFNLLTQRHAITSLSGVYSNKETYLYNTKSQQIIDVDDCFIIPGSFNPVHTAHIEMVKYVNAHFPDYDVYFELSVKNFEKSPIDYFSLSDRISGINQAIHENNLKCRGTLITNAPLFQDKLKFTTHCSFLVGADTYNRISNSSDLECGFIIFPRNNIPVYPKSPHKHKLVPDFTQINISSTELRYNANR